MKFLTDCEIDQCFSQPNAQGIGKSRYDIAREIEAKIINKIGDPVAGIARIKDDPEFGYWFSIKKPEVEYIDFTPLYCLPEDE